MLNIMNVSWDRINQDKGKGGGGRREADEIDNVLLTTECNAFHSCLALI